MGMAVTILNGVQWYSRTMDQRIVVNLALIIQYRDTISHHIHMIYIYRVIYGQ